MHAQPFPDHRFGRWRIRALPAEWVFFEIAENVNLTVATIRWQRHVRLARIGTEFRVLFHGVHFSPLYPLIAYFTDIPLMTSNLVGILLMSHRLGNCIPWQPSDAMILVIGPRLEGHSVIFSPSGRASPVVFSLPAIAATKCRLLADIPALSELCPLLPQKRT